MTNRNERTTCAQPNFSFLKIFGLTGRQNIERPRQHASRRFSAYAEGSGLAVLTDPATAQSGTPETTVSGQIVWEPKGMASCVSHRQY
jgi:hypothetical protein